MLRLTDGPGFVLAPRRQGVQPPALETHQRASLSQGGTSGTLLTGPVRPCILLMGLGWWVVHAFPSMEAARVRHAARGCGGGAAPGGPPQPAGAAGDRLPVPQMP